MAEEIVQYEIGADVERLKRAFKDAEAFGARLGDQIAKALSDAGYKGTRDLGNGLDKGIRDAGARSSRTADLVGRSIGRGLAVGIVAAGIRGISEVMKSLLEVEDAAKRTGLSIEKIGALRNVGASEGISAGTITSGLESLGDKANKEFREGEGQLSALLEANNLKLTDREGKLKNANVLLENAARLVANANTEFDKIDIAKIFGLTKDWVKILENGPEALRASVKGAEDAGGAFDRELVQRAASFDRAWSAAWASFSQTAKAAIASAVISLDGLINKMDKSNIGQKINKLAIIQKLEGGVPLLDDEVAILKGIQASGKIQKGSAAELEIDKYDKRQAARFRRDEIATVNEPVENSRRKKTVIPKSGGGSDGGKSEEDKAEERLSRYTESLRRQGDVLQAQVITFALSNAEQKSAIELAKAKVDLEKLDGDAKRIAIDKLKEAVAVNEQYRESLERLREAKEQERYVSESLSNALADIAIDGKNASDVLRNLVKTFARDAINALLSNSGPFKSGSGGGLFGSLLSGFGGLFGGGGGGGGLPNFGFAGPLARFASGGELPRGFSLVGENGPELLRNSGSGVARVYPSGVSTQDGGGVATVHLLVEAPDINQRITAISQQVAVKVTQQGISANNARIPSMLEEQRAR